jgi:hypothetical protein
MRMLIQVTAALISVSGMAYADDKPAPKAEIQKLIVGKTINVGSASASYGKDGRYAFNGGNPGKYRVDNGRICVDFDDGQARCDKIIKDAGNYYLITSRGNRLQFRP